MEDVYILNYRIQAGNGSSQQILAERTLYFPNKPAADAYRVELNQAAQKLGIMEFLDVKIDKQPLVK